MTPTPALFVLCAILGALCWTLTEYVLHRFNGHEMKGRTRFSREHLAHHTRPDTFAPTAYKLLTAGIVLVPMLAVTSVLLDALGVAFTVGFGLAYLGYEALHRRIHTHAPLNRYGAWARRHHFHHHFNAPHHNHGVTSDLWDRVFGTLAPVEEVRVPRRHAPHWMLDESGLSLHPDFHGLYHLRGRGQPGFGAPSAP